jgi:hypothetical protein
MCEGRNSCILEDIYIWAKLGSSPRSVVMKIPKNKRYLGTVYFMSIGFGVCTTEVSFFLKD